MPLNWVDVIIVAVVVYYIVQGWRSGLLVILSTFAALAIALWFAIKLYLPAGGFISQKFGIALSWAKVFAYIAVAIAMDAFLTELASLVVKHLPKQIQSSVANKWLGAIVSGINGLIVVSFILLLILVLPLRGTIKTDIQASYLGKRIVKLAQSYGGGQMTTVLDDVSKQARRFMTVDPKSNESLTLDVDPKASDLVEDTAAEQQMVNLVNGERFRSSLSPLQVEVAITAVAQSHARDMFMRRYFSHISPEGKDAGDRLHAGGVSWAIAGENLAYAPDATTAHQGLMDSPEHKKNILEPQFHRVGIGIISAGPFGMMVVEDFTN